MPSGLGGNQVARSSGAVRSGSMLRAHDGEHIVPVGGSVVAARKEHPSKDRNEYSTRPPRRDWGGGALLRLLLGGSRRREAELVVGGTAGMTSDEKKVAFRQLYHAISRVNSLYIIEKYNSSLVCP